MKKSLILLLALILVLSLSLSACTKTPADGAPADGGAASGEQAAPDSAAAPDKDDEPADSTEPADVGGEDGADGMTVLERDGFKLPIPAEYADLVTVVKEEDPNGIVLFSVSETASVEAGELQHPGEDWGDGWLFSLGRVSEGRLHEMQCYDMSGTTPFAKDGGTYYVLYRPTDVRICRDGDITDEDMQQWSALCDWAYVRAPEDMTRENGLTAYSCSNTDVDIYLSNIAYGEDVTYSLASLDFGGDIEAPGFDGAPYAKRLLDGVVFEPLYDTEAPDGEYIVLNVTADVMYSDSVRFDFFSADGNCIREVFPDGYEVIYRATYADGKTVARDIMAEWCAAAAAK